MLRRALSAVTRFASSKTLSYRRPKLHTIRALAHKWLAVVANLARTCGKPWHLRGGAPFPVPATWQTVRTKGMKLSR